MIPPIERSSSDDNLFICPVSLYDLNNPVTLDPCGHMLQEDQVPLLKESKCPICQSVFTKAIKNLQFGSEIQDSKKTIKNLKSEKNQLNLKCQQLIDIWAQIHNLENRIEAITNQIFQDIELREEKRKINSERLQNMINRVWFVIIPDYISYLPLDKRRTLQQPVLTSHQINQLKNEKNNLQAQKNRLLSERDNLINPLL